MWIELDTIVRIAPQKESVAIAKVARTEDRHVLDTTITTPSRRVGFVLANRQVDGTTVLTKRHPC